MEDALTDPKDDPRCARCRREPRLSVGDYCAGCAEKLERFEAEPKAPAGGMERQTEFGIVDDPDGERRSLMHRSPCVCNGESNGVQCEHYWYMFQRFRAANADGVRDGDKRRNCTHCPSFMLEFVEDEKPTRCNGYTPRRAPGLVNIVKRAAAHLVGRAPRAGVPDGKKTVDWGFVPIDMRFEAFRPMTDEEIKKLRELFPDAPQTSRGKRPDQLSVQDIINGPQIGPFLKPGEKPDGGMSGDTADAIDGIFGGSGMFKK